MVAELLLGEGRGAPGLDEARALGPGLDRGRVRGDDGRALHRRRVVLRQPLPKPVRHRRVLLREVGPLGRVGLIIRKRGFFLSVS